MFSKTAVPGKVSFLKFYKFFFVKTIVVTENCIIAGNFNSRVGTKGDLTVGVINKYWEELRNNKGKRVINFCIFNNF